MAEAFATPDDVADLWRPLSDVEANQAEALLQVASAQLRQRLRNIDDRIALYATDPAADLALDPILVVNAVVGAVRRYMDNPSGALSRTTTTGPYSQSEAFGSAAGQASPRGMVIVTDDDVRPLLAVAGFTPGVIRQRPWWASRC